VYAGRGSTPGEILVVLRERVRKPDRRATGDKKSALLGQVIKRLGGHGGKRRKQSTKLPKHRLQEAMQVRRIKASTKTKRQRTFNISGQVRKPEAHGRCKTTKGRRGERAEPNTPDHSNAGSVEIQTPKCGGPVPESIQQIESRSQRTSDQRKGTVENLLSGGIGDEISG